MSAVSSFRNYGGRLTFKENGLSFDYSLVFNTAGEQHTACKFLYECVRIF